MSQVISGNEAAVRLLRTIVLISGIATLAFFFLTIGRIGDEWSYLNPVWSITAVIVIFGIPIVLAVVCYFVSARTTQAVLGFYAIAALALTLTYPLAMTHTPMPVEFSPWPVTITALNTVPAALAFSAPVAWAYLFVDSAAIALVRWLANGEEGITIGLQDAFFTFTFSGIFTALAIVTMRSARTLDRAAGVARATAVRRAAAMASNREQARLDALLHDDVMTTLFYASQGTDELDAAVRRQAVHALAELSRLGDENEDSAPVDATVFTSRLRSVILGGSGGAQFSVFGSSDRLVPGEVAAAFAEAAAEAVRNSRIHAGKDGQSVTVKAEVSLTDGGIDVTIEDDGVGFDSRTVRPHRLGILVSIRGRMSAIPGGSASVESNPGEGVLVRLHWSAS